MPLPACARRAVLLSLSPMQAAWLLPWATAKAAARMGTNPDAQWRRAIGQRLGSLRPGQGRARARALDTYQSRVGACPVYCKWGAGATCTHMPAEN